ncbi:MAG: hypothetical protein IPG21_03460 [Saprospiraceae bacterium]|nr:hypothetical protein [Candidatus Vicinibacter affinis]
MTLSGCFSSRHISKLRMPDVSQADTIRGFNSFEQADFIQMEGLLNTAKDRII